jgi:hypothetical protein
MTIIGVLGRRVRALGAVAMAQALARRRLETRNDVV